MSDDAPGADPGRPDNLPEQPTRLIGREEDLAAVAGLIRDGERLITLSGPGGAGKTRLGIAAAAAARSRFDAGTWMAELGALARPEAVAPAILAALSAAPDRDPVAGEVPDRVAAWLAGRRALLLLDNFEQLVPAAPLVAALRDAAPGLVLLVTSRVPLGLPGEREWPVAPLAIPDLDERDPAVISAAPAVRLFTERARAAAPGFILDPSWAGTVAAICRRLDGLPLAIELAAARAGALPPAAILARLDERFDLLSGGPRDLPGRHRSLDAAIDWSDALLTPREREIFHRLSVFHAPWTVESAAAVADATPRDLAHLAEHSLLRREPGPSGEERYRMLETVRAFASERLAGDPTVFAAARDRHADWFEQFAAEHENRAAAVNRGGLFDLHLEDILAAIDWREREGRSGEGLRTAIRLGWYWYLRGRVPLGARLLAGVEEDAALPPAERAAGLSLLGLLRMSLGDLDDAARALDAAEALYRVVGDESGELDVREHRADLAMQRGDLAAARALRVDLLSRREAAGDPVVIASAMNNLAEVEQLDGDDGRALALLDAALSRCDGSSDPYTCSIVKGNLASLGAAMALAGHPDAPPAHLMTIHCRESLTHGRDSGDAFGILVGLLAAAMLAARESPEAAARLAGAAGSVSSRSGIAISGVEAMRRSALLDRLAQSLADSALAAALAAGAALPEAAAVHLALEIVG